MRILVIRRDNIGDLVCTTPLLAALRARYAQAHLAALVNSYNVAVLEGNPHVDAVHSYTKLKHRAPGESRIGILAGRLAMLARLRREPFDYVVLAKDSADRQGLALARQLRRRNIVGFANPGDKRITVPVPALPNAELHEVQVLQLLAAAMDAPQADGPVRVYPRAALVDSWRRRLSLGARRRWIALHVSAREAERRWPAERCAELIRRLASADTGMLLLWSPGAADNPAHPGDDDKAAEIMARVGANPAAVAAPTASLADLIAVLALCRGFIGADGGALHIAAGLGLPIVGLYEERKTKRWHPWKVPYEMVVTPTGRVEDIPVEEVAQAAARLAAYWMR
ncbi:MAG TPA: glycosyltransferase family 9 protein [Burkholderiales bacterium]|nr:glycosyltransferase family 9 protein [Burkholderiales bacterium]